MSEVYIVTGEDYDYCIIQKVFKKKEDAEDYVKAIKGEYANVTEYEVCENKMELKKYWRYEVNMWGKLEYPEEGYSEIEHLLSPEEKINYIWDMSKDEFIRFFVAHSKSTQPPRIGYVTSYIDDDHAKSLGVEMYRQCLQKVLHKFS